MLEVYLQLNDENIKDAHLTIHVTYFNLERSQLYFDITEAQVTLADETEIILDEEEFLGMISKEQYSLIEDLVLDEIRWNEK